MLLCTLYNGQSKFDSMHLCFSRLPQTNSTNKFDFSFVRNESRYFSPISHNWIYCTDSAFSISISISIQIHILHTDAAAGGGVYLERMQRDFLQQMPQKCSTTGGWVKWVAKRVRGSVLVAFDYRNGRLWKQKHHTTHREKKIEETE